MLRQPCGGAHEPAALPYNPQTGPMRKRTLRTSLQVFLLLITYITLGFEQAAPVEKGQSTSPSQTAAGPHKAATGAAARRTPAFASPSVCAPCIRAHMQFLASDALRGRGSGTPEELIAAIYIGAQLEQFGLQPAGDHGTFIQRAEFVQPALKSAPTLGYQAPGNGNSGAAVHWTYGKEFLV